MNDSTQSQTPAGPMTLPAERPATLAEHGRQFVKFALVGGSGVVVNLAVFNLTLIFWHLVTGRPLSDLGLVADYTANLLGFVVSVVSNYYLNRRWTFRSSSRVATEFPKFLTVSVAAYLVNLGIFTIAHTVFHFRGNLSQLIAIAAVLPVNYLANKFWSFRQA